ncbi:sister chromatid cohesion protein PDS5 homolog B-like [Dysidea avara]|uniref:sister chromatid cohesion protein PDS5 homolog B-like n=1 Tax=Dysidea avara TaxID=196820 RepID=UPI0033176F8B
MPPSKKRAQSDLPLKEITQKQNKEELIKRLTANITVLMNYAQPDACDAPPSELTEFAYDMAQPFVITHKDKDVRLLAACAIAEVLRICAPKPPYDDEQLKNVFTLFINQLHGLDKPSSASYQRCLQLLESLAQVQSFVVLANMPDAQDLILSLFKTFFNLVNEATSANVHSYMLDSMVSVIQYGENIPPGILDVLLINITESHKASDPHSYKLAVSVIQRAGTSLEPYVQRFFNSNLVMGEQSDSDVAEHVYELLFELNRIEPSVLLAVLPQLEYKLKSNDVEERVKVTQLLAKMFTDRNSVLASQNVSLWNCFLGRFEDISTEIRKECIKFAKHFLVYHPVQAQAIAERLCQRALDPDEQIRLEVVRTICEAAAENLSCIPDVLTDVLKARMRDKKWTVKKEALTSVARLYRKIMSGPIDVVSGKEDAKKASWMPNKILHAYYQEFLEDKICAEKCLITCLVPVTLEDEEVVQRLLLMFSALDDHAKKAFGELLKTQQSLRNCLTEMVDLVKEDPEANKISIMRRVMMIVRVMPDTVKTQTHLSEFVHLLKKKPELQKLLSTAINPSTTRQDVIKTKGDIISKVGPRHAIIDTVRTILDRACATMTDCKSVAVLVKKVSERFAAVDMDLSEDSVDLEEAVLNGIHLLNLLSSSVPEHFCDDEVFETFMGWLRHPNPTIVEMCLEVFVMTGEEIKNNHPQIVSCLQSVLTKLAAQGTVKQGKYAVRCFNVVYDESKAFGRLYSSLVSALNYDNTHLLTVLTSLGQIALLQPQLFATKHKAVMKMFVLKDLLMVDRCNKEYDCDDQEWCPDDEVSKETHLKVRGHKLMVRWLLGITHDQEQYAIPVLKLFDCTLANDGDLNGDNNVRSVDRSRLRMSAACGLLRLARVKKYCDLIDLVQLQRLALTVQDSCQEVRHVFITKLHKGLIKLQLPLYFLSMLAFSGTETNKQIKTEAKDVLVRNVAIRRTYVKQHSKAKEVLFAILPEYSLPYIIYFIAHHPDFQRLNFQSLDVFRDCLWMLLEPIVHQTDNFPFLSKLIQNIKQTKDAQDEGDEEQNKKLYAVCDLAHELLLFKLGPIKLAPFPGEPLLPTRLYTASKNPNPNQALYLPVGYSVKQKKPGGAAANLGISPKSQPGSGSAKKSQRQKDGQKSKQRRSAGKPKVLLEKLNSTTDQPEGTTKPTEEATNENIGSDTEVAPTDKKTKKATEAAKKTTGGRRKRKEQQAEPSQKRQRTLKEFTADNSSLKSVDEQKEVSSTTSQIPQRGRRKRKQEQNEEEQAILSDDSQSTKRKKSDGDSSLPALDSASAEISTSQSQETDKTPSQDATDGARLENGLTQTPDSQEEIKESEEDIKESQEEIKESEEAKEVTKPGRKNVRQASKKDTSSTQTTGKIQRKLRRQRK